MYTDGINTFENITINMNKQIIQQLETVSIEEQIYLNGDSQVKKDLYTTKNTFEIDCSLLLKENKLITVRPHSRFIEFPQHGHNYVEIMYVCRGTITHFIDGKQLVLKQGDIILLNQHVKHSVKKAGFHDIGINFIALPEFFDTPLRMLQTHNVLADFLMDTLRQKDSLPQYLLFHLQEDPTIDNLMENMILTIWNEYDNENVINQYSMGLIFLYLLNHLEHLAPNSSQSYEDILLHSILKYIDANFKTASLCKIADDLHQSPSVLSRSIKHSTGFTFQELLIRKRFEKAISLLLETELPIEEIITYVGYENYSFFYRQFKKRYGMTPRNYRLAHRDDDKIWLSFSQR